MKVLTLRRILGCNIVDSIVVAVVLVLLNLLSKRGLSERILVKERHVVRAATTIRDLLLPSTDP
jgi:hypothetical protein